jgi:hypothetical protein
VQPPLGKRIVHLRLGLDHDVSPMRENGRLSAPWQSRASQAVARLRPESTSARSSSASRVLSAKEATVSCTFQVHCPHELCPVRFGCGTTHCKARSMRCAEASLQSRLFLALPAKSVPVVQAVAAFQPPRVGFGRLAASGTLAGYCLAVKPEALMAGAHSSESAL